MFNLGGLFVELDAHIEPLKEKLREAGSLLAGFGREMLDVLKSGGIGADLLVAGMSRIPGPIGATVRSVQLAHLATDGLTAAFKGASAAADAFGGHLGMITGLLAAGGTGLLIKTATESAITYETALVNLGKAAGVSGADLQGLRDELEALSTKMAGVKLDEMVAIATESAKLGVARKDLLAYVEGVAMVRTAIDSMSAGDIANKLGGISVVLDLGNKGTMQLGSAIDRLADATKDSHQEIIDIAERVGVTAKLAKVSTEEMLGLATTMAQAGSNPEAGGTALVKVLELLSEKDYRKTIQDALGLSNDQFEVALQDRFSLIVRFLEKLRGMDEMERSTTYGKIGIEGAEGAQLNKLLLMTDKLRTNAAMAKEEFRSLNQINVSYQDTAGTSAAKLIQGGNRQQIQLRKLGDEFRPVTERLSALGARFAEDMGDGFGRIGPAARSFAENLGLVVNWLERGYTVAKPFFAVALDGLNAIAMVADRLVDSLELIGKAGDAGLAGLRKIAEFWAEKFNDSGLMENLKHFYTNPFGNPNEEGFSGDKPPIPANEKDFNTKLHLPDANPGRYDPGDYLANFKDFWGRFLENMGNASFPDWKPKEPFGYTPRESFPERKPAGEARPGDAGGPIPTLPVFPGVFPPTAMPGPLGMLGGLSDLVPEEIKRWQAERDARVRKDDAERGASQFGKQLWSIGKGLTLSPALGALNSAGALGGLLADRLGNKPFMMESGKVMGGTDIHRQFQDAVFDEAKDDRRKQQDKYDKMIEHLGKIAEAAKETANRIGKGAGARYQ